MSGFHIDRELIAFGAHVRAWRMVLGLTAQQVCERADISRQTLRKIEKRRAFSELFQRRPGPSRT